MPFILPKIKTSPRKEISVIPASECLAKTRTVYKDGGVVCEKGCDVYTHLWITCRILQTLQNLWKEYPWGKIICAEALWMAALHDIGKVTPEFVNKIYRALNIPSPWSNIPQDELNELAGGHARSSEIILDSIFGSSFARLVAAHHGGIFWSLGFQDTLEKLGGESWQQMRKQIIARLEKELSLPSCDLRQIPESRKDVILGAATLADWLSSSMDLPWQSPLPAAEDMLTVVQNANIVPLPIRQGLSFAQLFGFPTNSLQQNCDAIAQAGNVYIIESGMGSGKTEAALYLAYQLLEQKKANGVYFALPTKLTSEKIHDRLNDFLRNILPADSDVSSMLIHGDAWLDWDLREGGTDGIQNNPYGSWFQSKKRALLAPFAAGTADQALLAVINAKHRALRAFALAGKVVILDEVHSYDSYTGTLIATLVKRICEWGGTAIVLSATLTTEAKAKILGLDAENFSAASSYPLITIRTQDKKVQELALAAETPVSVTLSNTSDDAIAFAEALNHAQRGEQVLWIENTVADAQKVYRTLSSGAQGIELGLIHSRYPASHRQESESYWVNILGKHGAEERRKTGRILVATQVLEQSVDVDSDFLITRLAPCDMILQRLGRLWRHPQLNAIRPQSATRSALLLIHPAFEDPEKLSKDKRLGLPYDRYWLYRTVQCLKPLHSVSLPEDIRPLLEKVYADQEEKGPLAVLKNEMTSKKERLELCALGAQGTADAPCSDESAGTRVNDMQEVQVLLIRKGNLGIPLTEKVAALFAESPISLPSANTSKKVRMEATRTLLRCMIKVPAHIAPSYEDFRTESFLKQVLWTGDGESHPVRAAYIDDSSYLLTESELPVSGKYELSYHEHLGYVAKTKEKKHEF